MKIIKKHRMIFYVPGMISLVVLPILFLWFSNYYKSSIEVVGLKIGIHNDAIFNETIKKFDFPNLRKYKIFVFNSSLNNEKNNLRKFQKSLRNQNKYKDTINGIKVQFGKKMTYEVYIKVLDILQFEITPTYALYEDNLWILNGNQRKYKVEKTNKIERTFVCSQNDLSVGDLFIDEPIEMKNAKNELLILYYKKVWYLYAAYLGLVILNIFALLKFNRNRKYNQKSYL